MAGTPTPRAVQRSMARIGDDLTTWRKLRHLTLEEVAGRAGMSSRTLKRLEGGEGASLENVLRVARALGVMDAAVGAFDPYATDVGRLRADEALPERVRRRSKS